MVYIEKTKEESVMSSKINRILVLVFGATTGVTLNEFVVGKGFRLLWSREIPWVMDGKVYLWPITWLCDLLTEVKAMARPGDIITLAMWGADVVHIADGGLVGKVIHYRSVPGDFAEKMIVDSGVSEYELSRLMGNVHAASYQAVFQDAFWRLYTGNRNRLQAIPMADWMTYKLTGQKGHDQSMLHNQGQGVETSARVNQLFDSKNLTEFAPWNRCKWSYNGLVALPCTYNAYVVPCTHDSPLARLVLASTGLKAGVWTGSWYGVNFVIKEGDNIIPSERTHKANLVFEAMPGGGVSAISNIGMHGPLWKALKNARGEISYAQAAEMAMPHINWAFVDKAIFTDEIMGLDPVKFVERVMRIFGISNPNALGLTLAALANTIAVSSRNGLADAAKALGIPCPTDIAIVGGFAENRVILEALRLHGLNVTIPPFAGLATQAGAAAQALFLAGKAKSIKEALGMLPDKVLTE